MEIAGGLYYEICETPNWRAQFGSGGRAAAAISALSPGSTLHTYTHLSGGEGERHLRQLGISVSTASSPHGIAFVYFHPLSRPHIEPALELVVRQPPLQVAGENVLRYGFLEGTAVVSAARAVYDPQTPRDPEPFHPNGSRADSLALVMNERELLQYGKSETITDAVANVFGNEKCDVLAVKQGVRGASIFEANGSKATVPAYRSSSVFKLGTGDVFSSIFAHFWAEAGLQPQAAADLASRSVAAYCETRALPVHPILKDTRYPLLGTSPSRVILRGAINTIGRRFTLEEARFCLQDLGMQVMAPDLEGKDDLSSNAGATTLLVVADGLDEEEIRNIVNNGTFQNRVVLDEERCTDRTFGGLEDLQVTSDFASALYFASWPVSYCS